MTRQSHCSKCEISREAGVFPNHGGVCKECLSRVKKERRKGTAERDAATRRKYNQKNKDLSKHLSGMQRARKKSAIPLWADINLIRDMYKEAHYFGLHIDHIIPLNGINVCGLHWEGNLQALTNMENYTKGNLYISEINKLGEPVIDYSIMGYQTYGAIA